MVSILKHAMTVRASFFFAVSLSFSLTLAPFPLFVLLLLPWRERGEKMGGEDAPLNKNLGGSSILTVSWMKGGRRKTGRNKEKGEQNRRKGVKINCE